MSLNLLGSEKTTEIISLEILKLSKDLVLAYYEMKANYHGFKFTSTEVNSSLVETYNRLTEAYKGNLNFLKGTKPEQVPCFTDWYSDILGNK